SYTSLGTRSNVGMAKPSPPVRQAGNIWRLLMIRGVCRRNLPSACAHVTYRCRCRVLKFFIICLIGTKRRCHLLIWPIFTLLHIKAVESPLYNLPLIYTSFPFPVLARCR